MMGCRGAVRRTCRPRAGPGRGRVMGARGGRLLASGGGGPVDGLMMDYPLTVPALLDRAARYFPRC